MKLSQKLSLMLALLLIVGTLAGCGTPASSASTGPSANPSTAPNAAPSEEDTGITFPLAEPAEFSMWTPMYDSNRNIYTSLSDHPAIKLLEEKTNITIKFVHPTAGSEQEDFNLMMSSQDYEDVFQTGSSSQSSTTLYDNSVIYDLTDLIEKNMPNYSGLIASDPAIEKDVKDDNGKYLYMYSIYDQVPLSWGGYAIRKDLLDKAGLGIPETYSDWETAGLAFKDMGVATPVFITKSGNTAFWNTFESGFGIGAGFYRDGTTVKYGPMEPGYKEYVTLMYAWYQKGILNKEFYGAPGNLNGLIVPDWPDLYGGSVGACGSFSSHLASQIPDSGLTQITDMYLTSVTPPVKNKGDKVNFTATKGSGRTTGGDAISTAASEEMVPIIMSFFDYLYGEEGSIIANYGIEGKSFEFDESGKPHYTDIISSTGYNGTNLFHVYDYALYSFPELDIDKERIQSRPQEIIDLQSKWVITGTDLSVLPALTLTADESARASSISNDAGTYVNEMTVKFITGQESLANYSKMIDTLNSMNITEAIAINQSALDRYNAR